MYGRPVAIVGQHLHGIGEVDDNRARRGFDVDPAPIDGLRLQPAGHVLEQQGQDTRVGVMAERRFAKVVEPGSFSFRHRITARRVVQPYQTRQATAEAGGRGWRSSQSR